MFQSVDLETIRQREVKSLDLLIKEFEIRCRTNSPPPQAEEKKKTSKRPRFLQK